MAADSPRNRAREAHRTVRADAAPSADLTLPVAAELLEMALRHTGIAAYVLPADDPLLGGAHAALDRDAGYIWCAAPVGPQDVARMHFALAHELAHFWLHPYCPNDRIALDEERLGELIAGGNTGVVSSVAEGYSPLERREREANLFAAEFLLPAPIALRAIAKQRMTASQIAERTGLPYSLVAAQLSYALSLPLDGIFTEPVESRSTEFELDDSQRRAAEVVKGPVLVEAGPGTGKTRTLIARAIFLLDKRSVAPENLLMLTFSNRAAEEIRSRLRAAVGPSADRAWIGTFHSLGMEILRKDGIRIGIPPGACLIETTDAIALLERNVDRLALRAYEYLDDPSLPFADLLRCISRAKDELVDPAGYAAAALRMGGEARTAAEREEADRAFEAARFYEIYEELLCSGGYLDFGDLIKRAIELLDTCSDVRDRWTKQFPFILVDEYQDVNRASAQLVSRLVGSGAGFWAVGDVRQAIYRFRGASPANVTQFEQDYPGGIRIRLNINYRSSGAVVDLFAGFAGKMPAVEDAVGGNVWQTARAEPGRVSLADALDEESQADGIAASILSRVSAGVPLDHQAVLCTTNNQCAAIGRLLEARNIPVRLAGGMLERLEIKQLLAIVSLAAESSGTALAIVAAMAEYQVPHSDVRRLWKAARAAGNSFPAALSMVEGIHGISDRGRRGLTLLRNHVLQPGGDVWSFLCRYLFETGSLLRPMLDDESSHNRQSRLAIHYLLSFVHRQAIRLRTTDGASTLLGFLSRFRRMLRCGEARLGSGVDPEGLEAVSVLTVHQSKGLEFPVVYLPNLNHNQFPIRVQGRMAEPPPSILTDSANSRAAEESDRSLFFVALSRARDEIVLSRPLVRRGKPTQPSHMLSLIERETASAVRLEWSRGLGGDVEGAQVQAADTTAYTEPCTKPEYSIGALDQYYDCPRRFYYRHVAHVPQSDDKGGYRTLQDVLRESIAWLLDARAAGNAPSPAEAMAELEARLGQLTATAFAANRIARDRTTAMFRAAVCRESPNPGIDTMFTADLPNGRVRISADELTQMPNGDIVLAKYIYRRPRPGDHLDERLALLRRAARQRVGDGKLELRLRYLDGATEAVVAESPRYEPARVELYNRSLGAIVAGKFEAKPETRRCSQCPFLFVCPE